MKVTKTQLKQIIAEELENMELDEAKWLDTIRAKFGSKDFSGAFADAVGADSEDPTTPAADAAIAKMSMLAPQLAQVDDPNEIRDLVGGLFTALSALNQNDLTTPELRRVGLELVKIGRSLQSVEEPKAPEISPDQQAKEDEALRAKRARTGGRVRAGRPGGTPGLGGMGMGGAAPARQPMRENKKRRVKRRK
jgi:hypothetical protein